MIQKLIHYLLPIALLSAGILIVIMAVGSAFNRHPDEQLHYASASYFFSHWLPPAVNDPRLSPVYKQTPWGVSYLNRLDTCYFAAAKFAKLTALLGVKSYLGLRFFQVSLFLLLVMFALWNRNNAVLAVLLLTPQAWYVFSYMNGDAFPLFLAVTLGFLMAGTNGGGFSNYLRSGGLNHFIRFGLPVAACLALLALSKKNYYIFVIYILFVFVVKFYAIRGDVRQRPWGRICLVCMIAVSIFGLRFGYDIYINGWNKNEKIRAAAEKYADAKFKPSIANKPSSYRLLRLKQKGVSYPELFTEYNWHRESFYSFFGVYGYMEFFNEEKNYRYTGRLLLIMLAVMAWVFIFRQDHVERIFTLGTLMFIFATLLLSSWHSWVYAFQPQGRYLFPILPMVGIWLTKNSHYVHKLIVVSLMGAFFFLSVYSFYKVGLGHLL